MSTDVGSVDWEKDIYSLGSQLNLWPFSDVVSTYHHHMARWPHGRPPRVLEVGCGTGNNLWALSQIGFDSVGLERAQTAVEFGISRFAEMGVGVQVVQGEMISLPFENESFDFVLDRGGITQVPLSDVELVASEIFRVLRPGGFFNSFTLFGDNHPGRLLGQLQNNGSYDFFTGSYFATVGLTSFFSADSLRNHFRLFGGLSISRTEIHQDGELVHEEYSVCGQKPSM